jgi:hypothetical protein
MRKLFFALTALCAAFTLVLAGCSGAGITRVKSGVSTMSVEDYINGHLSVSFGSFSGSDSLFITPESDGTYTVIYDMEIGDGLMTINVLQGKELIESVPIYGGESAGDELTVDMEGGKRYEVKILATDCADGRYDVVIAQP